MEVVWAHVCGTCGKFDGWYESSPERDSDGRWIMIDEDMLASLPESCDCG